MRYSSIFLALILFSTSGYAATIHVPGDYAKIQEAIGAAVPGDTILVGPGLYEESISYLGKEVTVQSTDGAEKTVIHNVLGAKPVVRFDMSEGSGAVLDGFTVENGKGLMTGTGSMGGGIYCKGSSPTIKNNIITNNSVGFAGGGIGCRKEASPTICNNIIRFNTADNMSAITAGGGIACETGSAIIINNLIYGNSAVGTSLNAGGGIVCNSSNTDPLIAGNLIFDNTSNFGGGIMCSNNPTPTLCHNLIYNNSATLRGGGIQCYNATSEIRLIGNTLHGNTAGSAGGGIMCNKGSVVRIDNTILWNNDAVSGPEICLEDAAMLTIGYSDSQGGQAAVSVQVGCVLNWMSGMMDEDPLFVDTVNNDFHLPYDSPCRDAGLNSAVPACHLEDFEVDPRTAHGTVDMGADEFHQHLYCTGDATPGGTIQGKIVGLPATTPVGLFLSAGALASPVHTLWGDFHLQAPFLLIGPLWPVPSSGVMVLTATLPATPAAPYDVPMQALIGLNGDSLSNLYMLKVR